MNEIDLKVHAAKRLIKLKVHQDGFKLANSLKWWSAIGYILGAHMNDRTLLNNIMTRQLFFIPLLWLVDRVSKSRQMVRVFRTKLACNYNVSYDNVVNPEQVYRVDPLAHDFLISIYPKTFWSYLRTRYQSKSWWSPPQDIL